MKKTAFFMLLIITAFVAFAMPASAQTSAEFYIPDGAVYTGDEFDVTVVFTSDSNIGWIETNFVYDSSAVQFVSGDGANGGGGILTVKEFPVTDTTELSVTLKFIALKEGSSQMQLSNCAIFSQDSSLSGSPTAYAYITASKGDGTVTTTAVTTASPDESSSETSETTVTTTTPVQTSATVETGADGYPTKGVLTSITVSDGELIPAFSPDIYDYVVKVDNSVDYFEVEGTTADITDYIWYSGSKYLQVGDNIRKITVTSNEGTEHTYTITIQRASAPSEDSEEELSGSSQGDTAEIENSSSRTSTAVNSVAEEKTSALDQYKQVILPALGIVMFVLILALIIVITWLKRKTHEEKEALDEERAVRKRNKIQKK